MIQDKIGNLLEGDVDVIVHQANLYHTFGSGIAKVIREVFPEAFDADLRTVNGDPAKLGTVSLGKIKTPKNRIKFVFNLYSQNGIGGQDRLTSYDAMVRGLEVIKARLLTAEKKGSKLKLGIPWHMGCGLANGNWNIVRAVIESVFEKSGVDVVIYQRPEDVNAE